MVNTKQFIGIDYLKFVAALMVVAIHTGTPYYLEVVFRVAVPFFFISSSFLFWYRKKSLGSYITRMALLYLAWFIIEIPFVYQKFVDSGPWEFLRCLFFSNTFFASWYISASIEGMALLVLLSRWLSNVYLVLIGSVLYCIALLGGGYYGLIPNTLQGIIDNIDSIIPLSNSVISSFLYCVSGKLFADKVSHRKSLEENEEQSPSYLSAIVFSLLYICEFVFLRPYHRYTDTFLLLPFLVWTLLCFATMSSLWRSVPERLGSFFRKTSTLVYFIHFIVLSLLTPLLSTALSDKPVVFHSVKFVLTVVTCVAVSYMIINLSKKWKLLRYLY